MAQPGRRQRRTQARLARELGQIGFALPGSLVWRSTKCGKARCRCQGDPPELHGPYLSWTRAVAGKTITRRITAEQQQRYQQWFDNARQLHELVTELQTVSLKAFDETEGPPPRS